MQLKYFIVGAMMGVSMMATAKGTIRGTVVNKETGEPMDYVTIQLVDGKTNKPLTIGTMTGDDGTFTLVDVADGPYVVKITNIGSVMQERPVSVSGADVNVGTIRLADDAKMLKEVVVEGVRSQMKFELDKKVFTVDADITSSGLSASEVLESIPSVEVDQDGEVSLRGNSSVTVWINGKDSGLTADNQGQILEQIPGETIEKIEVITNPSAKYSPEGTAGIINIILKKDSRGGYFGSAEIGANTRGGANAGFNINYNNAKWDTYASLGLRMRHNKGGSRMRRTFDPTEDVPYSTYMNSDGTSPSHGNNIFLRLGATYHLTEKDEFYLNGFGMLGHRWGHSDTYYWTNQPSSLWDTNDMYRRNKSDNRGSHLELGYKHTWGENHTIDIMGAYNYWGGPSFQSYRETHLFEDDVIADKNYTQDQTRNTQSAEAKVDYVQMLLPWLKMEAGFQGNYGFENSPVTYNGLELADDAYSFNRFIYRNNISALYLTLGGKVKDFSFSAGLRSESWQVRFKSLNKGMEENSIDWTRKNFFQLFPSAYLSYSLPFDNEIQINYTRRIRRPWGGQLNTFRDLTDPTNVSYGNPNLEPEYNNSFELNYIKSWTMHMISLSAYLRTGENMMNRISYLDGDVMYSTWTNVAKQTNSGVEIVVKDSFWRGKIDLTTTVNLYNNHISAWKSVFITPEGKEFDISGAKQNAFAWDARMMFSIKLPWSMSFQATGRYASKQLTAMGSRQPGWSVDAGLRKNLGNWSFSISARDLFDSRKFKDTVNGVGYTQTTERWRGGRRVQFTVKYSFGNMKKKPNSRQNEGEPMEGGGFGEGMEF